LGRNGYLVFGMGNPAGEPGTTDVPRKKKKNGKGETKGQKRGGGTQTYKRERRLTSNLVLTDERTVSGENSRVICY